LSGRQDIGKRGGDVVVEKQHRDCDTDGAAKNSELSYDALCDSCYCY
jgi:hypothetical protein